MSKPRVLLFTTIRKPPAVLRLFLESVAAIDTPGFELTCLFYDDNHDRTSSEMLAAHLEATPSAARMAPLELEDAYEGDHRWNPRQIRRIAEIKNRALQAALERGVEHVFLLDADVIVNPALLAHLRAREQHVVAGVFWTLFFGEAFHKPNAWDRHSWAYDGAESILRLREPGTHAVGGTGACMLVSRAALEAGVSFDAIANLPFPGEDRHFCTRALVLGFPLLLDTHYPSFHVFSDEQVAECEAWLRAGAAPAYFDRWLDEGWEDRVRAAFREKSFVGKLRSFVYQVRRQRRLIFGRRARRS